MTNKKISTTLKEYMENVRDSINVGNFRLDGFSECLLSDLLPQYVECVDVTLNEEELRMYKHNVKSLSKDMYNTPDLAFLICDLNGHKNSYEFNISENIKLPSNKMVRDFTNLYNNLK